MVLIGGLGAGIYFGWPFLMGLFGGDPFATPDGTIKYVANGLADNKPQVLWEAMPASYKQTLNEELKKSMANTDPEVHAKSVAVLQKLTGVLRDKKPLIIETVNGLSQGAGGGLPPELTDNWDDIVGLLDILTKGKMADMAWVQNPNLGDMLADEGSKIMAMSGLEKLLDQGLQENVGKGPKSMMEVRGGLRNIEVIIVSQTDSEATLKVVSKELSGDPDDAESGEFVMVRTEERWLPKEMVDAWDEGIDELKKEIQREIPISSMAERKMTEEEKNQILALLDVVDQALDSANQATNSQELTAAVMGAAGGVMGAAMAGGKMVAVAWGVYLAQAVEHNLQRVSLAQDWAVQAVLPQGKATKEKEPKKLLKESEPNGPSAGNSEIFRHGKDRPPVMLSEFLDNPTKQSPLLVEVNGPIPT